MSAETRPIRLAMLDPTTEARLDRIRPFAPDWQVIAATSRAREDQLAALQGADFAITGDVPVDAAMMAVPGLKAVHKWGVGYDNIDLTAARAHGVRVLRTTGSNAVTVAETTLGLILAVSRNIGPGQLGIARGAWLKDTLAPTSIRLSGRVVGIIGLGHIGQALARLLTGFGCEVIYAKRTPLSPDQEAALNVRHAALPDLLARADVVTLNTELNETTRDMINRDTLALMKPGAILVNAARGGVVVEEDLAEALRTGHLRGAGVDVFAVEPITPDNPLLDLPNVVLTPHIGAVSGDSFAPSVTRMIANLRAIAEGEAPPELDVLA